MIRNGSRYRSFAEGRCRPEGDGQPLFTTLDQPGIKGMPAARPAVLSVGE